MLGGRDGKGNSPLTCSHFFLSGGYSPRWTRRNTMLAPPTRSWRCHHLDVLHACRSTHVCRTVTSPALCDRDVRAGSFPEDAAPFHRGHPQHSETSAGKGPGDGVLRKSSWSVPSLLSYRRSLLGREADSEVLLSVTLTVQDHASKSLRHITFKPAWDTSMRNGDLDARPFATHPTQTRELTPSRRGFLRPPPMSSDLNA